MPNPRPSQDSNRRAKQAKEGRKNLRRFGYPAKPPKKPGK
jgi:hypothetical protein